MKSEMYKPQFLFGKVKSVIKDLQGESGLIKAAKPLI